MAWWKRVAPMPPAQTEKEQDDAAHSRQELEKAHFDADVALETVQIQNAKKRNLKKVIEGIREENHFVEIWKGGVGA